MGTITELAEYIDAACMREAALEKPRPHMGVSMLGHPCDRWLWLSFRWAVRAVHEGRILRLFERGKQEEKVFVNLLRAIGKDVRFVGDRQRRADFGCHVSGSMDGILYGGIPGHENEKRIVCEFKTHNKKSFDQLEKHGVEQSKPEHALQLRCYMRAEHVSVGLYCAVCKDDDRLYFEAIGPHEKTVDAAIERGKRIALEPEMPEALSDDPTWYQCKMCAAHTFCHKTKLTKEVNCRTCAHATPLENGDWRCERFKGEGLPTKFQRSGCEFHVLHPDLVPWPRKASNDPNEAIYLVEGEEIRNGEADAFVYGSKELIAGPEVFLNPDVNRIREKFEAQIDET